MLSSFGMRTGFNYNTLKYHWIETHDYKLFSTFLALITTSTRRITVSTSLWKCSESIPCQTYTRNFHKSVKDTDVKWRTCTPFSRKSKFCSKTFKFEILYGHFSKETSVQFYSNQVTLLGPLAGDSKDPIR